MAGSVGRMPLCLLFLISTSLLMKACRSRSSMSGGVAPSSVMLRFTRAIPARPASSRPCASRADELVVACSGCECEGLQVPLIHERRRRAIVRDVALRLRNPCATCILPTVRLHERMSSSSRNCCKCEGLQVPLILERRSRATVLDGALHPRIPARPASSNRPSPERSFGVVRCELDCWLGLQADLSFGRTHRFSSMSLR